MSQDNGGPSEQPPTTPWWKTLAQSLSEPFRRLAQWISSLLTRNEDPADPPIDPTTHNIFGMTELPESTTEVFRAPPATVETPVPVNLATPSTSAPLAAEPAPQPSAELKKKLEEKAEHWKARLKLHGYPDRAAIDVVPSLVNALYLLDRSAAGQLELGSHQQQALKKSFDSLDQGLDSNNLQTDIVAHTLDLDKKIQACQLYIIDNLQKSAGANPPPSGMPPKHKRS